MNNGGWEIKVLDGNGRVQAANNWWGKESHIGKKLIGPVVIQPALEEPIEFNILE